jgi:hypothetical protein
MNKKLLMAVLLALPACLAHAQNSFPASGNSGVGTTETSFSPLTIQGDVTKNLELATKILELKTNEAFVNNPFKLTFFVSGQQLLGNRSWLMQTGEHNVANGGTLSLQPLAGKVGIGTTSPSSLLQVNGMASFKSDNTSEGYIRINKGEAAAQGYIDWWKPGNARVAYMGFTDGVSANNLGLTLESSANFVINGGNVGIGTTDPRGYKLAVAGNAIAESVTVKLQSQWPDYVFKPSYLLRSIAQTASYIKNNGHLPEMPSEKEIKEKGVDVGEMLKLQTKKIEELTLYLIDNAKRDQRKQNLLIKQQRQILEMKKELTALKRKITKR